LSKRYLAGDGFRSLKEAALYQTAVVSAQRMVGPDTYQIRLEVGRLAKKARPGQFIMLRTGSTHDPILARPFSVHGVQAGEILLLYKVVGKGTGLLAQAAPGTRMQIWGPLGRGFDLKVDQPVLVAGGLGLAPVSYVVQRLKEHKIPFAAVYGARTQSELLMKVAGTGWEVLTDDGSYGRKGLVTEALAERLPLSGGVLACGPLPMLKAVALLCLQKDVPCQVSLEAPMACGIGACLGCVMPAAEGGYFKVCQDGPVMDALRVDWQRV
jgi:dihydroorotate dehydrogenase electron transfer subunit